MDVRALAHRLEFKCYNGSICCKEIRPLTVHEQCNNFKIIFMKSLGYLQHLFLIIIKQKQKLKWRYLVLQVGVKCLPLFLVLQVDVKCLPLFCSVESAAKQTPWTTKR